MNRSRLLLGYILDRRAGVLDGYSVPQQTTCITQPATRYQREGDGGFPTRQPAAMGESHDHKRGVRYA